MYNLLKYRQFTNKTKIDKLENVLGFELPTLYKIFVETFELGDGNVNYKNYHNPKNNRILPCVSIVFFPENGNNEVYFNGLFNEDELLNDWENYTKTSKEWLKFGLLRIGDIGIGGGLYIGTKISMREKIYRVVWDWNEDFDFLAGNIFEFYKKLKTEEDFSNMEEYKYSQLYKNWDEDFWRVR